MWTLIGYTYIQYLRTKALKCYPSRAKQGSSLEIFYRDLFKNAWRPVCVCLSPHSPPTLVKLEAWKLACIILTWMAPQLPIRFCVLPKNALQKEKHIRAFCGYKDETYSLHSICIISQENINSFNDGLPNGVLLCLWRFTYHVNNNSLSNDGSPTMSVLLADSSVRLLCLFT